MVDAAACIILALFLFFLVPLFLFSPFSLPLPLPIKHSGKKHAKFTAVGQSIFKTVTLENLREKGFRREYEQVNVDVDNESSDVLQVSQLSAFTST